jgi:arabinose-5-phosphate isomerase
MIDIKNLAIQAIENEAAAVLAMRSYITNDFVDCVNTIYHANGRIIISGIGKSAVVAQKIVATLNSTGSPAVFMHAADAIHGDLGIVQQNDIVILISKSGESPEIKYLVPFIKNFGNKLVAITGNLGSFLAQQADFVLNTTIVEEACPNNLAPTTSTTVQMVMGDILAICLMECRGFKSEHFAKYHPGGALGKKLYTTVYDLYINNKQPAVNADASLQQIIIEISSKRLGATAVVNEQGDLLGIITDGDIRRCFEKNSSFDNITAATIMNTNPKTIASDMLAVDALQLLKSNNISQLVVTEQNKYAGIIHLHEILKEGIV